MAHCIREIRNCLLHHLVGPEADKPNYKKLIDDVAGLLQQADKAQVVEESEASAERAVTLATERPNGQRPLEKALELIKVSERKPATMADRLTQMFRELRLVPSNIEGGIAVLAREFLQITDKTVGYSHNRVQTDIEALGEFEGVLNGFEAILHQIATADRAADSLGKLDAILQEANRPAG